MKIIGLTGKSKVGRQFVADYLAFRGFVIIECRDGLNTLLERTRDFGIGEEALEKSIRESAPYAFCNVIERLISEHGTCTDLIVIPDVLHEVEAQWVREHGHLWHISWNDDGDLLKPCEIEPIVSDHGTPDQIHAAIDDLILSSLGIDFRKSVQERVLRTAEA